jgi:predicted transcriptional regulator
MDPSGWIGFTQAADVLEDLPIWLSSARGSRGMSLAEVAVAAGVSIPVIARVERGLNCQANTAVLVLRWLGSAA